MCIRSPIAAETNAATRKVIPAHSRLPVKKNTSIAASVAIGKANKKPMKIIAASAMMRRIIRIHQNSGSVRLIA